MRSGAVVKAVVKIFVWCRTLANFLIFIHVIDVWYLISCLVSAFTQFVTPWCVSACVRGKMAASTSPQTQTIAEKLSDCRCCNKSDGAAAAEW